MQQATDPGAELLNRAVRRAGTFPVDPLERKTLHDIVCAFVDEKRAESWAPEQIVSAVKRAVNGRGFRPPLVRMDAKMSAKDALLRDMVDWCIHRYYQRSE